MSETPIPAQPKASDDVSQIAAPPEILALSTLDHVDYADAFLVQVGSEPERTAEQWARTVLDGTPASLKRALQSGWSAIGLKLYGSSSDRSLLGWEIRRRTPEFVLLGADSRIGMPGELLFKRQQDMLLCATFVQHDNDAARQLWARVEPAHESLVRRVLKGALRRGSPSTGPSAPPNLAHHQTPQPDGGLQDDADV
jgi:hypothetical protein